MRNLTYFGRLTRPEGVVSNAAVTFASAVERVCASAGVIVLEESSEGIGNGRAPSNSISPGL